MADWLDAVKDHVLITFYSRKSGIISHLSSKFELLSYSLKLDTDPKEPFELSILACELKQSWNRTGVELIQSYSNRVARWKCWELTVVFSYFVWQSIQCLSVVLIFFFKSIRSWWSRGLVCREMARLIWVEGIFLDDAAGSLLSTVAKAWQLSTQSGFASWLLITVNVYLLRTVFLTFCHFANQHFAPTQ